MRNLSSIVCFIGVLAFIAIPFSVSCIGDEPVVEVLELQEPAPVPMVVEVQDWCDDCIRQPVRKVLDRKIVKRVVVQKPVVETYVEVTRQRRVRRQPVRSIVRRLFCR